MLTTQPIFRLSRSRTISVGTVRVCASVCKSFAHNFDSWMTKEKRLWANIAHRTPNTHTVHVQLHSPSTCIPICHQNPIEAKQKKFNEMQDYTERSEYSQFFIVHRSKHILYLGDAKQSTNYRLLDLRAIVYTQILPNLYTAHVLLLMPFTLDIYACTHIVIIIIIGTEKNISEKSRGENLKYFWVKKKNSGRARMVLRVWQNICADFEREKRREREFKMQTVRCRGEIRWMEMTATLVWWRRWNVVNWFTVDLHKHFDSRHRI